MTFILKCSMGYGIPNVTPPPPFNNLQITLNIYTNSVCFLGSWPIYSHISKIGSWGTQMIQIFNFWFTIRKGRFAGCIAQNKYGLKHFSQTMSSPWPIPRHFLNQLLGSIRFLYDHRTLSVHSTHKKVIGITTKPTINSR